MLKLVKNILYRKRLIKPKNTIDKINFLLHLKISLYDEPQRYNHGLFIEKDIIKYTNILKYFNNFNKNDNYLEVRSVNRDNHHKLTYSKWCSNNNTLLDNEIDHLQIWLKEANFFIINKKILSSDLENVIGYSNYLKLVPYYTNIERIATDLISYQ